MAADTRIDGFSIDLSGPPLNCSTCKWKLRRSPKAVDGLPHIRCAVAQGALMPVVFANDCDDYEPAGKSTGIITDIWPSDAPTIELDSLRQVASSESDEELVNRIKAHLEADVHTELKARTTPKVPTDVHADLTRTIMDEMSKLILGKEEVKATEPAETLIEKCCGNCAWSSVNPHIPVGFLECLRIGKGGVPPAVPTGEVCRDWKGT